MNQEIMRLMGGVELAQVLALLMAIGLITAIVAGGWWVASRPLDGDDKDEWETGASDSADENKPKATNLFEHINTVVEQAQAHRRSEKAAKEQEWVREALAQYTK